MRLVLDGSEACAELVTECNGKKQVMQKIIVSTSGIRESLATPLQCDGLVDPQSGQPYHAMGCTVFSYPVIHYALRMSAHPRSQDFALFSRCDGRSKDS